MTPTVGVRPTSLFPPSLTEENAVERQRYLVARILEGDRPQLSAPSRNGYSVAERLRQIPNEDQRALREAAGPSFDSFVALGEESIPAYFYEGLLQAGRRAEDGDRFEVAQRCYFYLSELNRHGGSVPESVERRARQRLEVLGGGGSFGDRAEFAIRRIPDQTLDPTFFIGMGGAVVASRLIRLNLLARAANTMGVTPRFVPQIFRAGVAALAESLGFVAAERAGGAILGRRASEVPVTEEWLRFSLPMFMATRLAGTTAGQLYRRGPLNRRTWLPTGSLEGAPLRHRLGYTAFTQASIFGATLLAQGLESQAGKAERIPRDDFAQALLWSMTFAAFSTATRRVTGRRVLAWERGLFQPR